MEGMEDPEYYSSDFFVRTLGSEDIDVKHFMYLVGRVSIYCDGTDNITGVPTGFHVSCGTLDPN